MLTQECFKGKETEKKTSSKRKKKKKKVSKLESVIKINQHGTLMKEITNILTKIHLMAIKTDI